MRETHTGSKHIDRPQGRRNTGSDERMVSCVVLLFLIVLIAAVSMLQSSRIRFLERRIQALEKGSAAAASDLVWKEDATRRDFSDVSFH